MKKLFILAITLLVIFPAISSCVSKGDVGTTIESNTAAESGSSSQVIEIKSFDGYMLKGKLTLPGGNGKISKLVIFVNGSVPNTYDSHRNTGEITFNYFDFWAKQFSTNGIAFFSYNARGIDTSNNPPLYADINEEEYKTNLPLNEVEDVYYMINALKENERLKNCKVCLLSSGYGTIVAPLVAQKYPGSVDALFLCGYANDNMKDLLTWQTSGANIMAVCNYYFDTDGDGRISKSEYEADPNNVVASVLGNASFESFDTNNDGYLTEEDFIGSYQKIAGYSLDDLLNAINQGDNDWLKKYYGGLTSAWFLQHFDMQSNMDLLPTLNLPIYIFHGTLDQAFDLNGVYAIKNKFAELGKTNLTVNVFDGYDHDLNYMDIINKDTIPDGIQKLIDAVVKF